MRVYSTFREKTELKKYLFADLDDSLFQALKKCHGAADLNPAAFLKDGSPISFTTAKQRAFFNMVDAGMTVIPVTARNLDAFLRVRLPFASYAILNYGGVVLNPDHSVDNYWLDLMHADMEGALPGLQQVMHLMDDYAKSAGLEGRARLIEDFSTPFYVVMKDPGKVAQHLEQVERKVLVPWLASEGKDYFVHRNGNNLAVLPNTLNKARAVSYLCDRLKEQNGEILTIGLGDSQSDARFMAACDYAILPRSTQLAGLTLEAL
jgi:hydroxymethylpyrimidine pyrophosphatase-like HAD family hydrolase